MAVPLEPEVYLEAAVEHMRASQVLDEAHFFALAHYTAGLAVECLLLAYLLRSGQPMDTNHYLLGLWRKTPLRELVSPVRDGDVATHVATVCARWHNTHRFRSDAELLAWLRGNQLDRQVRIRGDRCQYSSGKIVEACAEVVSAGVMAWRSWTA